MIFASPCFAIKVGLLNSVNRAFIGTSTNGEIVNVGNDHEISILDLARLIKERARSQSDIEFIPYLKAYGVEFEDIFHRRPIVSKLKNLTGFQPGRALTETIDGLIETERQKQCKSL